MAEAASRGLRYPLGLISGKLALSEGDELITESIISVLETRQGERVMRPGYGTPDMLWEALGPPIVAESIRVALKRNIRIEGIEFEVTADESEIDEGGYLIQIEWTLDGLSNILNLSVTQ